MIRFLLFYQSKARKRIWQLMKMSFGGCVKKDESEEELMRMRHEKTAKKKEQEF